MLVLSRRIGESFFIGDDMEVMVLDISGGKVVLGVQAPKSVAITRLDAPETPGGAINQKSYGRKQKNRWKE